MQVERRKNDPARGDDLQRDSKPDMSDRSDAQQQELKGEEIYKLYISNGRRSLPKWISVRFPNYPRHCYFLSMFL